MPSILCSNAYPELVAGVREGVGHRDVDVRAIRHEQLELLKDDALGAVVLVMHRAFEARLAQWKGIPLVNVAASLDPPHLFTVRSDEALTALRGLEHLLAQGHQHIWCVESTSGGTYVSRRKHALEEACRERGIPLSTLSFPRDADQLVQLPRPAGAFAIHEGAARELLLLLKRRNISVPLEVSVVCGGDDPTITPITRPPLSAVPIPWREIGRKAAQHCLQGNTPADTCIEVPPLEVIVRESSIDSNCHDPMVTRALHLMHSKLHLGLNIDQLLDSLTISRTLLEKLFKEHLGETPHRALTRLKLEKARQLLTSDHLPLEEVAHRSGYANAPRLVENFRRHFGQTPARYRKLYGSSP